MTTTKKRPRSQPKDLSTAARLSTTMRAVGQGLVHQLRGKHETQMGRRYSVSEQEFEAIISRWPASQKNVAQQMVSKYGLPNEATRTRLFWYENAPWKRTELSSDVVVHDWPTIHSDFLTQVIDYRVPVDKFSDIAEFDGSILLDRTKGEVAARCDSEAANVLGLNMVHEIVTGRRTVEGARQTSAENTVAYNLGRSAPYAERLLFEPPKGRTDDKDHSMIVGSVLRQTGGKIKDIATGRRQKKT